MLISWVKPDGTTVETNDRQASIAAAKALGWTMSCAQYVDDQDNTTAPNPRRRRAKEDSNGDS